MNFTPDVDAIPDLTLLTDKILEFIEFYDLPETKTLKENNIGNYNYIISQRFEKLPTSMMKLLSDEENRASNLEKIMEMLTLLQSVKDGRSTFEKTENDFFEKRAEEYIYPKFGGRENFYKVSEQKKLEKEKEERLEREKKKNNKNKKN
jgi:hypothetical protein